MRRKLAAMCALVLLAAGCDSSSGPRSSSGPTGGSSGTRGPAGGSTAGSSSSPGSGGPSGSPASSGPSGSGATSSAATGGGEGQVGTGPPCPITSSAAVAKAFGGAVSSYRFRVSGVGKPLCTFLLRSSNVGAAGTVTLTSDSASTASVFATLRRDSKGAVTVSRVGDDAFFLPATSTLYFRRGSTTVVVQALLTIRAGTKLASRIKADIVALAVVTTRDL